MGDLDPDRKGADAEGEKKRTEVLVNTALASGARRGETPNRLWEREESGREYMGTLGLLGSWRYPPEVAVRTEPSGILKRAGGRDAGSHR